MNKFYLKDEIVVQSSSDFTDSLKNQRKLIQDSENKKCLEVTVDATHCGYFNHNSYFYLHDGMAKAVSSWLHPYNKPVLSHHVEDKTAIGRVTQAAFIPLLQSQKPNDAGKDEKNANVLRGKPSGKIRLKILVTDESAIDYILDQRFFTVSTGGSPVTAPICSICKKLVEYNGYGISFTCDHTMGKVYDGKLCGLIIDEMDYKEVSFINSPADYSDEHVASVISMQFVDINSNSDIKLGSLGNSIDKSDKVDNKSVIKDNIKKGVNMVDFDKLLDDAVKQLEAIKEGESIWKDEDEIKEAEELARDYETTISLSIGYGPEDKDYDDTIEDKKLPPAGSKARAKMKTTFCGPNKTFPVPDCKHCAVALAMLKWPKVVAKYSASVRAKITACVRSKAKALNCPTAKPAKKTDETEIVKIKQDYDDKVKLLDQQIVSLEKKIHENDSLSKESKDELKKANDIIGDLTKDVRIKYAEKIVDLSIMQKKANVNSILAAKDEKERDSEYDKKVKEISGRSSDSLLDSINDLKKDLNLSVVSDKVDNPVVKDFDQIIKDKKDGGKEDERKSFLKTFFFGK